MVGAAAPGLAIYALNYIAGKNAKPFPVVMQFSLRITPIAQKTGNFSIRHPEITFVFCKFFKIRIKICHNKYYKSKTNSC